MCKGGGCAHTGGCMDMRKEVDVEIMTVDAYCALVYGPRWDATEKSRKSKRDTVSRMCREKVLKSRKAGKRWLIEL